MGTMDSWGRWFTVQHSMVMRDIDFAWTRYGLHDYIPAPYHYTLVTIVCMLPFALVCSLLCCLIEEDEPQPQVAKPQPAGSKASKVTSKPEKLE